MFLGKKIKDIVGSFYFFLILYYYVLLSKCLWRFRYFSKLSMELDQVFYCDAAHRAMRAFPNHNKKHAYLKAVDEC